MKQEQNSNLKKCHCRFCDKLFPDNFFKKHLQREHNLSLLDSFIEQEIETKAIFGDIPEDVIRCYLSKQNGVSRTTVNRYQFLTFFKSITLYRKFEIEKDIRYFFEVFLPWKQKHRNQGNNKEQCFIIFHDDTELAEKLYHDTMLSKNPYFDHHGKFSPYSDNFIGYKNLSEDEIKIRKKKARHDEIRRSPVNIEYWTRRGFSEEEAREKVRERQQTFTLEKCIKKYGEEKGRERWYKRQEKWLTTLRNKPISEIKRINHKKVYKQGSSSGIEKEFLHSIIPDETFHNVYLEQLHVTVDLLFNKKVIEFYGDYWHCNPKLDRFSDGTFQHQYLKMSASEKWDFDRKRIQKIQESGYDVMIIWENDYINDKETTIRKCKEFLEDK